LRRGGDRDAGDAKADAAAPRVTKIAPRRHGEKIIPDPNAIGAASSLLDGSLTSIPNILSAAAGLGLASMGLVDSSKAIAGGASNFGFKDITKAIGPFLPAAAGPFDKQKILTTLRANWLNGVAKADQKAKAKALIHLGLTIGNAAQLAAAAGVDPARLTSLAQKVAVGAAPTQDELNVLGQFDVILSAVLDAAYERGDQLYRNASKACATGVSTLLALATGWLILGGGLMAYVTSWHFGFAFIVGISATPLAPMAKDLSTSLQAAAAAVGFVKR
jgi:hypothetical protein